jgi:hypothetical protein
MPERDARSSKKPASGEVRNTQRTANQSRLPEWSGSPLRRNRSESPVTVYRSLIHEEGETMGKRKDQVSF